RSESIVCAGQQRVHMNIDTPRAGPRNALLTYSPLRILAKFVDLNQDRNRNQAFRASLPQEIRRLDRFYVFQLHERSTRAHFRLTTGAPRLFFLPNVRTRLPHRGRSTVSSKNLTHPGGMSRGELEAIVAEENLNTEAAEDFIKAAFQDGAV